MSTNQNVIEKIHAAAKPLVIAITGGGSGAIPALLEVPGASASVLEAIVPYAATALEDWLGGPVDQFCSERIARAMAMASFERARQLSDVDPMLIRGIGATASLATSRPKLGPHRIHVAWQSANTTVVTSCELAKGERSRREEEQIAADLILSAVAEACGVERPQVDESVCKSVERREKQVPTEWTELLLGRRQFISDSLSGKSAGARQVVFPGAFNPLHSGHQRMAEVAKELCGQEVTFELSITNVDKPPLDFLEIDDRMSQFSGGRVLLTRAATFVEKAQIVPGCVFVVGVDTLVRIGEPQYYGGDPIRRDEAIASLAKAGCRFLVFGRTMRNNFCNLSHFKVPAALRELCDEVPEAKFREDVSSTELRGCQVT